MLNEIDLSRVDLNLLVVFEAVYAERHVSRAALRLSLTPSAVSHGLNRLRLAFNDPLFLRTPRGVSPTALADGLAAPIADALARVRAIIAVAAPFDPATSTRRFVVGAPDAVSAVLLPHVLEAKGDAAPGIAISIRQLLASQAEAQPDDQAWRSAFTDLDARAIDLAVLPTDAIPDRFFHRRLYDEDFVVAMRKGHALAQGVTLDAYCAAQHLVVSASGDPYGFVDRALAQVGRTRRIGLTVPNFMFAIAVLGETDLVGALPRRFAQRYARKFGIVALEPPLPLVGFRLNVVAPKPAMMDEGLQWFMGLLGPP